MKTKEIAKITKVSESYVRKVKAGDIGGNDKATVISMLLDIETHLRDIFADEKFWDMCETAIWRSRSVEVRKFAVRCQHICEIIRKEEKVQGEEKNEPERKEEK